jgi:hypothetical protein
MMKVSADAPIEQWSDEKQHGDAKCGDGRGDISAAPARAGRPEGSCIDPRLGERLARRLPQHDDSRSRQIASALEPRPERCGRKIGLERVVGRREGGRGRCRRQDVLGCHGAETRPLAIGDRPQMNEAQAKRRLGDEERRPRRDPVVRNVGRRARPRARDARLVVNRDGNLVGRCTGLPRFADQVEQRPRVVGVGAQGLDCLGFAADELRDLHDGAHHRVESLMDLTARSLRRGGIAGAEPPQLERAAADREERRGDDAASQQPPPADMPLPGVDGGHSSSRIPQR